MNSFSYSQLSAALSCQQLYKYLYVDKLVVPEKESFALHFGSALHAGLNALMEGTDGNATFNAYWDSVVDLDFESGRHDHANLRAMGDIFLDRFSKLHLKYYKFIKGEERLYATLPSGIKVEGTMDCLAEYKGKLSLIDFKTSSTRYPKEKVAASDQLRLYAYLAQKNLNVRIEQLVYVVFVKTKEPSIQVLAEDLNQEELTARIANIDGQCWQTQLSLDSGLVTRNHNNCFSYGRKCKYFELCHTTPNINVDTKTDTE